MRYSDRLHTQRQFPSSIRKPDLARHMRMPLPYDQHALLCLGLVGSLVIFVTC